MDSVCVGYNPCQILIRVGEIIAESFARSIRLCVITD